MRLLILYLLYSVGDAAKALSRDILKDYRPSDFVLSSPSSISLPSVLLTVSAAAILQHVFRKYLVKTALVRSLVLLKKKNDTAGVESSQSTDCQLDEAPDLSMRDDETHWKEQFETLQQASVSKTTLLESQIHQLQAQIEGDRDEMNYYKAVIDQQQTELHTQRDALQSKMMEVVQTEREKLLQEFLNQTEWLRDRLADSE